MKSSNLINSYFTLCKVLSSKIKFEHITRVSKSMKMTSTKNEISLKSLYGSWESDQTGDELVEELVQSRMFGRNRDN
jgi:hypothetical protein